MRVHRIPWSVCAVRVACTTLRSTLSVQLGPSVSFVTCNTACCVVVANLMWYCAGHSFCDPHCVSACSTGVAASQGTLCPTACIWHHCEWPQPVQGLHVYVIVGMQVQVMLQIHACLTLMHAHRQPSVERGIFLYKANNSKNPAGEYVKDHQQLQQTAANSMLRFLQKPHPAKRPMSTCEAGQSLPAGGQTQCSGEQADVQVHEQQQADVFGSVQSDRLHACPGMSFSSINGRPSKVIMGKRQRTGPLDNFFKKR